jgi:hypothetical protein
VQPITLTDTTFKPNIAEYYLRLRTFLYHRQEVLGSHHPSSYKCFSDLSVAYLANYLKGPCKSKRENGKCSSRALRRYFDFDQKNKDISHIVANKVASCLEESFLQVFLEYLAEELRAVTS